MEDKMILTLTIIHVVISVVLVVVVLMQHGKQQGLSGAIAGGAETFFGKNKGRTIDAMLKKATAVIAALFIISSLALTIVVIRDAQNADEAAPAAQEQQIPVEGQTTQIPVEATQQPAQGDAQQPAQQPAQ